MNSNSDNVVFACLETWLDRHHLWRGRAFAVPFLCFDLEGRFGGRSWEWPNTPPTHWAELSFHLYLSLYLPTNTIRVYLLWATHLWAILNVNHSLFSIAPSNPVQSMNSQWSILCMRTGLAVLCRVFWDVSYMKGKFKWQLNMPRKGIIYSLLYISSSGIKYILYVTFLTGKFG